MRLVLAVVVLASAMAATASASSTTLAQRVQAAATRSRFSGEVAVARHGRIVFARGYGLADRARMRRMTLDTAFNLASMGKMFTGVATAQLVRAGKLRFADRIGKYLPQLPGRMRSITFTQLLDHTSGLRDFFADPGYEHLRPRLTTLGAYLPLVSHERLLFKPGTRWSYSNSGFQRAGERQQVPGGRIAAARGRPDGARGSPRSPRSDTRRAPASTCWRLRRTRGYRPEARRRGRHDRQRRSAPRVPRGRLGAQGAPHPVS